MWNVSVMYYACVVSCICNAHVRDIMKNALAIHCESVAQCVSNTCKWMRYPQRIINALDMCCILRLKCM